MAQSPTPSDNSFSAAAKLDDLSDQEKQAIEDQSRPNAILIHETIRAEGESEFGSPASCALASRLMRARVANPGFLVSSG